MPRMGRRQTRRPYHRLVRLFGLDYCMRSHTASPTPRPVAPRTGVSRWSTAGLLLGWAACVLLLVYFLEVRPRERTRAPSVEMVPTLEAAFPAAPQGAVVY